MTAEHVWEVFDAVFNVTDTFKEEDVGAHLAYLMGAMLGRVTGKEPTSFVDWSLGMVGADGWKLWAVLKRDLPADHPVFSCITSDDGAPEAAGADT